jgi:DNA-binding XRE family transcriptional regulator
VIQDKKAKFMDFSEKIASRLRHLRIDVLQVTQKELSALLKLGKGATVSKYERGTIKPSMQICNRYIELVKGKSVDISYKYLRPDQFEK